MKESAVIHIDPPKLQVVNLRIVGTRPLMTHALSEEDKEALRSKAEKRATTPRKARVPWEKCLRSAYWVTPMPEDLSTVTPESIAAGEHQFGILAWAFKEAMVDAVGFGPSVAKTVVRGAVFPTSEDVIPVSFSTFEVDERRVVLSGPGRPMDLRYRPKLRDWSCILGLEVDVTHIEIAQVINLLAKAGHHIGVGEYRPQKGGPYGRFRVEAITE